MMRYIWFFIVAACVSFNIIGMYKQSKQKKVKKLYAFCLENSYPQDVTIEYSTSSVGFRVNNNNTYTLYNLVTGRPYFFFEGDISNDNIVIKELNEHTKQWESSEIINKCYDYLYLLKESDYALFYSNLSNPCLFDMAKKKLRTIEFGGEGFEFFNELPNYLFFDFKYNNKVRGYHVGTGKKQRITGDMHEVYFLRDLFSYALTSDNNNVYLYRFEKDKVKLTKKIPHFFDHAANFTFSGTDYIVTKYGKSYFFWDIKNPVLRWRTDKMPLSEKHSKRGDIVVCLERDKTVSALGLGCMGYQFKIYNRVTNKIDKIPLDYAHLDWTVNDAGSHIVLTTVSSGLGVIDIKNKKVMYKKLPGKITISPCGNFVVAEDQGRTLVYSVCSASMIKINKSLKKPIFHEHMIFLIQDKNTIFAYNCLDSLYTLLQHKGVMQTVKVNKQRTWMSVWTDKKIYFYNLKKIKNSVRVFPSKEFLAILLGEQLTDIGLEFS